MNILVSVSEAFLTPVKIMLYSLARHNRGLTVYLFRDSLTPGQTEGLRAFAEQKCGAALIPIAADGYFSDVPLSEQYAKPELYYRLLAPYILPRELDRVLYLDADMIVNGPLEDFYTQPLDGAYAAVVNDRFYFCGAIQAQKKKFGMKNEDIYFNSGVILFDLKRFRENISLSGILEFIQKNREKLFYFDQDILNCLLLDHKKLCHGKFNFQVCAFEPLTLSDVEHSVILHYTDRPKPWEPEYTGKLEFPYWSTALKAGFVEEYVNFWEEKERRRDEK